MDKERQYRNLFAQCHRSFSICDPIQARTLVSSWGPRLKIRGAKKIPTNIDHEMLSHGKWFTYLKCHTFHLIFPATEALSLGQLRKGGGNHHLLGTFDNKKIFIKSMSANNLLCIYDRNRQCYDTENQVLTSRTAECEAQIDLEPEQLTLITQKTADHATSSRRLVCYESRDVDSESFRTGIMWQTSGKSTMYITKPFWLKAQA